MPLEAFNSSASIINVLSGGVNSVGRSVLLGQQNIQTNAVRSIEESFASRIDEAIARLNQTDTSPKISALRREQSVLFSRKERLNEAIGLLNQTLTQTNFIKKATEHLAGLLDDLEAGTITSSSMATDWDNTLRKINILVEDATVTYKDGGVSYEKNLIKSDGSRTRFPNRSFLAPFNSNGDTHLVSGSYLGTDYFLTEHDGTLFWNSNTGFLDTEAATGTLTEFSSQAGFPGSPTGRTESVTSINTNNILVERFSDGPLAIVAAAQEAVTAALAGGASQQDAFAAAGPAAQAAATAIGMSQEEFEAIGAAAQEAITEALEGGASVEEAFAAASAVTAIGGNGGTGSSPDGEEVSKAFDNDADTKYSNTDGAGSGVLIDLSTARRADRFRLVTADDTPAGDPTSFTISGSNDGTTFTQISSQSVTAPTDRKTDYGTLDFSNVTKFQFYKVIFDTVRIPTTISDHSDSVATNKFTAVGGSGGTGRIPIDTQVSQAFDGSTSTKYKNADGAGSGVIINLGSANIVDTLQLTTANNKENRDPTSFTISGSNDGTSFTSIVSAQSLTAPTERQTAYSDATFTNSAAFQFYKVVFDSVRVAGKSLQISEIGFGTADRTEGLADSAYTAIGGNGGTGSSPGGEEVSKAFDNDTDTKYSNADGASSGVLINLGSTKIVDILGLTTADNETGRDPTSFTISGSNDGTNFTQLASQSVTAPTGRETAYSDATFTNTTAFQFYKVIFDSVRTDDESLQIGEISLGKSDPIDSLAANKILSIGSSGNNTGTSPSGEEVSNAFDGSTSTKYRNGDGAGSGVIIDLGSSQLVDTLGLTTADDRTGRDPTSFTISGSNDGTTFTSIVSAQSLTAPTGRQTAYSDATFTNSGFFRFYKLTFDSVRSSGAQVQVSEIRFGVQAAESVHISKINLGVADQSLDESQVSFTPSGGSSTTADITRGGLNILDAWMYRDFGTENLLNHAAKDLGKARGLVLTREAQLRLDTTTLQSRAALFDPFINNIDREISDITETSLSENEAIVNSLKLASQVAQFDLALLASRGNTIVSSLLLSLDNFNNGLGSSFKATSDALLGATLSIQV